MCYSSKISSSSAFHAGSTMHKKRKFSDPTFSINCFEFGGTCAESFFSKQNISSSIFKFPLPSKYSIFQMT